MHHYQSFSNWLKSQKTKAIHKAYPQYLQKIESILLLQLHNIQNLNYLKRLYIEFQTKRAFLSLSKHEQSNLKSGFASYIEFVSLHYQNNSLQKAV